MITSSLVTRLIIIKLIFDYYHLFKMCYDGGYYIYYITNWVGRKFYRKQKQKEIEDDYVVL